MKDFGDWLNDLTTELQTDDEMAIIHGVNRLVESSDRIVEKCRRHGLSYKHGTDSLIRGAEFHATMEADIKNGELCPKCFGRNCVDVVKDYGSTPGVITTLYACKLCGHSREATH